MGEMKYFFKWLVNDVKTSWAENAEARSRMWGHFLDMAKFLVRIFSVLLLIVVGIGLLLIAAEGGRIQWDHAGGIVLGLFVLNSTVFFADKIRKFRSEKDQLIETLKG